MNEYPAKLVRVIDGDTVELEVDLGFRVKLRETFRLYGINCPEMRGATKDAGRAAKSFAAAWFVKNPEPIAYTYKPRAQDKYGRWLAVVRPSLRLIQDQDDSLNEALLDSGHAAEAKYDR